MAVPTTFFKVIPKFMLGNENKPSLSMYLKLIDLFKYNVKLDSAKSSLKQIKNDISEYNVTIPDKDILHDLSTMYEEFDLKAKESFWDKLNNYRFEYLNVLKKDYQSIEKDYVESYDIFFDQFFNSSLGFKKYSEIPISKFNRQELIGKIQSFNLKSELNPFKKIDYSNFSDQALYLFYITTEPNSPPTSINTINNKLSTIDEYCAEHFPEMSRSDHNFDQSKNIEADALNEVCDNALDSLEKIGESATGASSDTNNPDTVPYTERQVNLTLPKLGN